MSVQRILKRLSNRCSTSRIVPVVTFFIFKYQTRLIIFCSNLVSGLLDSDWDFDS